MYGTPHAPGRLFVGVAPRRHVGEGSNVRSETKISNLDSDEFGSNPPFKKRFRHFHFVVQLLAGTMDLKQSKTWNFLKKNLIPEPLTRKLETFSCF
jgi:hypothetical protein